MTHTSALAPERAAERTGRVFNIQRFSVQDGPGIRTTFFMKGCPLACPWCSNPESQRSAPEVAHVDALCNACGRCVEACEPKAIAVGDKGVSIDRILCDDCGRCVEVCAPGALKIFGQEISVDEAFAEARKDELYYRNSGGGVTASGGEPLHQPHFVSALFDRCQAIGIHTTLDTCGSASRAALEMVLERTDLVLFDLKLIDRDAHRSATKATNTPILRNARLVAERETPLVVRVPLIPGFTDREDNITAIADLVRELGDAVTAVNILPYHRFGLSKYAFLDRRYELRDLRPPSEEALEAVVRRFRSLDVPCEIVR